VSTKTSAALSAMTLLGTDYRRRPGEHRHIAE
jgi:hypothetical protein